MYWVVEEWTCGGLGGGWWAVVGSERVYFPFLCDEKKR